jgi:hypothetical protein
MSASKSSGSFKSVSINSSPSISPSSSSGKGYIYTNNDVKSSNRGKQLTSQRLILGELLKDNYINITPCDMYDLLENIDIKKKESSSDTIIAFGNLKYKFNNKEILDYLNLSTGNNVVLKLSFDSIDKNDDNSLDVEIQIYKEIINKMVIDRETPNLMLYIGHFECRNLKENYQNKLIKNGKLEDYERKILLAIDDINDKEEYDINKANLLLLERGNGKPLHELMSKLSTEDLRSILFQLFYTLQLFNLYGLKHNDIHFGNVFIEFIDEPRNNIYFISDNTYFVVPIKKYLVKIYDFDLGSTIEIKNTKIENYMCKSYGICNLNNPKFDLFIILSHLYDARNTVSPSLKKFIESFIYDFSNKSLLDEKWGFPHRLCKVTGYNTDKKGNVTGECGGNYEPNDDLLKPIWATIIMSDLFLPYKHSMPNFDLNYLPSQAGGDYSEVFFWPTVNRNNVYDILQNNMVEIDFPSPSKIQTPKIYGERSDQEIFDLFNKAKEYATQNYNTYYYMEDDSDIIHVIRKRSSGTWVRFSYGDNPEDYEEYGNNDTEGLAHIVELMRSKKYTFLDGELNKINTPKPKSKSKSKSKEIKKDYGDRSYNQIGNLLDEIQNASNNIKYQDLETGKFTEISMLDGYWVIGGEIIENQEEAVKELKDLLRSKRNVFYIDGKESRNNSTSKKSKSKSKGYDMNGSRSDEQIKKLYKEVFDDSRITKTMYYRKMGDDRINVFKYIKGDGWYQILDIEGKNSILKIAEDGTSGFNKAKMIMLAAMGTKKNIFLGQDYMPLKNN